MPRHIKKSRDGYGEDGSAEAIIHIFEGKGMEVQAPSETAPDPAPPDVVARVNHGRWIGDCNLWDTVNNRTCLNAQFVDPNDPRFYCVSCFNAEYENAWRDVVFPADVAAVETSLEGLNAPEQNWEP